MDTSSERGDYHGSEYHNFIDSTHMVTKITGKMCFPADDNIKKIQSKITPN